MSFIIIFEGSQPYDFTMPKVANYLPEYAGDLISKSSCRNFRDKMSASSMCQDREHGYYSSSPSMKN